MVPQFFFILHTGVGNYFLSFESVPQTWFTQLNTIDLWNPRLELRGLGITLLSFQNAHLETQLVVCVTWRFYRDENPDAGLPAPSEVQDAIA